MSKSIKNFLDNPGLLFISLGHRGWFHWMDDETYLKIAYRVKMGKKLNLDPPVTFNEKLQWLKIHDRNPEYTTMVDKYEAKKWVADKIGGGYVIPTLGVWDSFDDIDFDKLPNQFVLKCTHDSGGLVICRDKTKLDKSSVRTKIEKCLKYNFFWGQREWPYKNVKPRIIAEKYMEDTAAKVLGSNGLTDYKFFCFNGTPEFVYVSCGLEDHTTAQMSFLDMNWEVARFKRSDYRPLSTVPPKPERYEEMKTIAGKLSKDIPFVRVDLYEVQGKVYFSEMTFFPCSGFLPFEPEEFDGILGKSIGIDGL